MSRHIPLHARGAVIWYTTATSLSHGHPFVFHSRAWHTFAAFIMSRAQTLDRKIDDMGQKIDELEVTIAELLEQANTAEKAAGDQKS